MQRFLVDLEENDVGVEMRSAVNHQLAVVGYNWVDNFAPSVGQDFFLFWGIGPFARWVDCQTALGGVSFESYVARDGTKGGRWGVGDNETTDQLQGEDTTPAKKLIAADETLKSQLDTKGGHWALEINVGRDESVEARDGGACYQRVSKN